MLSSFYATLFQPQEKRPSLISWGGFLVLFLVGFVLALTQSAGFGPAMLLLVAVLFWGVLLVKWLWLSGSLLLADRLMGGQGQENSLVVAVAESYWPLLLLAPAAAFGQTIPALGALFGIIAWFWFFAALSGAVKSLESWGWPKSLVTVLFAWGIMLGSLSLMLVLPLTIAFILFS